MEISSPEELREAAAHWDVHATFYREHPDKDGAGHFEARAKRLAAALRAAATILEATARRPGLGG
jgi:hypothetical protein